VITRFRDLGGNLAFVAANNMFRGIEVDAAGPASPPGTIVLARIAKVLGPGKSGEMTCYETAAGAKVFDAGAINLAATATQEPVSTCSRICGRSCRRRER
jgi:hypothetical protein